MQHLWVGQTKDLNIRHECDRGRTNTTACTTFTLNSSCVRFWSQDCVHRLYRYVLCGFMQNICCCCCCSTVGYELMQTTELQLCQYLNLLNFQDYNCTIHYFLLLHFLWFPHTCVVCFWFMKTWVTGVRSGLRRWGNCVLFAVYWFMHSSSICRGQIRSVTPPLWFFFYGLSQVQIFIRVNTST